MRRSSRVLALMAAALVAPGCGRSAGSARASEAAPEAAPDAAPAPASDAAPAAASWASVAIRCNECHGKMHDEWQDSAHARAARSPLYQALRSHADAASCDRCHAPLAPLIGAAEPAAREGVTCDVCHMTDRAEPSRAGAAFHLRTTDKIKFGPLCDAKDHYFHRMGCSPLHEEPALCGGCHLLYRGDVPIYTEYEEWAEGPYADAGIDCLSCHMPGAPGEVAVGEGERPAVHHHGYLGAAGDLRRRALSLTATVRRQGERLAVAVRVTNAKAGHKVPTGFAGRQVLLRVRALDAAGVELARAERSYRRSLGDAAGQLVLPAAATRVLADTRLGPKETRSEAFELDAPAARRLHVELIWQEIAPELAAQAGVPAGEGVTLVEQTLEIR